MSRRVRSLAVLVALLAGAQAALRLGAAPARVDPLVARFDPAAVWRVVLSRGERQVVLERRAGKEWVVASHGAVPVRRGAPEGLLRLLRGWRRQRVAGSDPRRYAEWGVGGDDARRVQLFARSGTPLLDLYVGRVTGIDPVAARARGAQVDSERLGLFVRAADEAEVSVVNAFLLGLFEPVPRNWFRRPLLEGRPEDVRRLRIVRPGEDPFELLLSPFPGRALGDPRPLDPARVYGLLQQIYMLEPKGAGRAPPAGVFSVELERAGEESERFLLWEAEGRFFFAGEGLRVELAAQAAQKVLAARLDGLWRRRLIGAGEGSLARLHWEEGDEEIALRLRRELTWEATCTGIGRPLASRRWPSGAAKELRERVAALEAVRWERSPRSTEDAGWARLVAVEPGRFRAVLRFGVRRGELREVIVDGVAVPGWVPEAEVQAIRAAFLALAPD